MSQRNVRKFSLQTLALVSAGVLAGGLLVGCGDVEPIEALTPVDPAAIEGNDAPLVEGNLLKADAPADDSIPFEGKADVVLPAAYDIQMLQTPVRNQASRGVCSIFSTMGLVESLYKKAGMTSPDFSEQYLQWSTKVEGKSFTTTSGSTDSANLSAVYRFGIVPETAWPYETTQWGPGNDPACTNTTDSGLPTRCYTNGEPPASARAFSPKIKLPSAGRYVSSTSIKNILFEKKAGVVVGMDFFYQSWNHRRSKLPVNATYFSKGYVLYPNAQDKTESLKERAGHSVQLVGWDDNLEIQTVDAMGLPVVDAAGKPVKEKGFYLFKNSWGTASFGITNPKGAGYGWISYRYVKEFGSGYTADPPKLMP